EEKHDRHDHGAGLENAGVGREHLGTVRQQHDHAVAGADAHARERPRHARGGSLLLHVGEVAPLEVQSRVLAEALDALFSEPSQVHAPDATIAAMRWTVLGLAWLAMAPVAHAGDDPTTRVRCTRACCRSIRARPTSWRRPSPRPRAAEATAVFRSPLALKIGLLIVVVLIVGFGVSTILTIQREAALLIEQNKIAARR